VVLIRWSFSFFTRGRGSRVIEEFEGADERATMAVGRR
jgi:hypothetical protein